MNWGWKRRYFGLTIQKSQSPCFRSERAKYNHPATYIVRDVSRAYKEKKKRKKKLTTSQVSKSSRRNWDPG